MMTFALEPQRQDAKHLSYGANQGEDDPITPQLVVLVQGCT